MATNTLNIDERLAAGKEFEHKILVECNRETIKYRDKQFYKFEYGTKQEDMSNGIDAWAFTTDEEKFSCQFKHRESGDDLGVALLRPYLGDGDFRESYRELKLKYDRDYRSKADMYCIKNNKLFIIVSADIIKKGCDILLAKLYDQGGFGSSKFCAPFDTPGAELRLLVDRGGGYSHGQAKVIAYFTPALLKSAGAYIRKNGM